MNHKILEYQKKDYKVKALEDKMIQVRTSLAENEPIYEINNLELDLQNKETYIQVCQMKLDRMNDKIKRKQQEGIDEDELIQCLKQRSELENMIVAEQKELIILQNKHKAISNSYSSSLNKLTDEQIQIEEDKKKLYAEIEELKTQISIEEIDLYENAKKKIRKPFAYVKNGACSVCHIQVPACKEQKIMCSQVYCDNCGRLFVAKVDK